MRAIAFMLLLMSSTSWAGLGPKLKVNWVEPGEVPLFGVERIRVVAFEGTVGAFFSERMRAAFDQPDRGRTSKGTAYLQEGFVTNPFEVAAERYQAVMSGETVFDEKLEDTTQRRKKRDAKGKVVKDADGKAIRVDVPCLRRTVRLTVRWELRSNHGAGVLASGEEHEDARDERCEEKRSKVDTAVELARAAAQRVAPGVVERFLPTWTVHTVGLRKSKANKAIVKQARLGDWDGAMCRFRSRIENGSTDPDDRYNLAAIYEVKGWYAEAEESYQAAVEIDDGRPYRKALTNIQDRRTDVRSMAEGYAVDYQPSRPPQSDICEAM